MRNPVGSKKATPSLRSIEGQGVSQVIPEQNTTNYYKIVFGRIIFWLVILYIAKYVYLLGDKWLTGYNDKTRYQQAWETLYQQQPKRNQKMMQNILTKP